VENFLRIIMKLSKSLPAGFQKKCKKLAKFQAAVSISQFMSLNHPVEHDDPPSKTLPHWVFWSQKAGPFKNAHSGYYF